MLTDLLLYKNVGKRIDLGQKSAWGPRAGPNQVDMFWKISYLVGMDSINELQTKKWLSYRNFEKNESMFIQWNFTMRQHALRHFKVHFKWFLSLLSRDDSPQAELCVLRHKSGVILNAATRTQKKKRWCAHLLPLSVRDYTVCAYRVRCDARPY